MTSSACLPALVLGSNKILCGKGFVNPKGHKGSRDGRGGGSDEMSHFHCQPRGHQFISIRSLYLGSPTLCLMVS